MVRVPFVHKLSRRVIRNVAFFIASFLLISVSNMNPCFGGSKLTAQSENIVVYSGPGTNYRPLRILSKGTTVPMSSKIVTTETGEFYKILLRSKKRRPEIGYIPIVSAVFIERTDANEGIEKYKSLSLSRSSFQGVLSYLKEDAYLWTGGYLKYPAPGYFIKAFVGQIFSSQKGSPTIGIESGNDSLAFDNYSLYASVGVGLVFPGENDPFVGAKAGGTTLLMNGSAGIRYNAAEHAAIGLGLGQVTAFNKNNSFVSLAIMLTFEVGL